MESKPRLARGKGLNRCAYLRPVLVGQKPAGLGWSRHGLAAPQGKGIAREIPGLNQPIEETVEDRQRLALALPVQRLGERTPVGRGPRRLLRDLHDPAVGWLRIFQEGFVGQEILVGQIGQGLSVLVHTPKQQPFRLLAIACQRGQRILVPRQPSQNRRAIVIGCDLGHTLGPIAATLSGQVKG